MKILIADDHELFLKGLEMVLNSWNKNLELRLAHNYLDIFEILKTETVFDLVVTDLAMPGDNWLEAIKKIHKHLPDTPIIILSAVFDREIVKQTIEIGAAGYLSKTASNKEIINAMELVLSGGAYIPQDLMTPSLNEIAFLHPDSLETQKTTLTPRQIDVLKLIAKGCSNKVIAHELGLTEGTVKLHVTAILKILNVYNRTGAVMEATKRGIING